MLLLTEDYSRVCSSLCHKSGVKRHEVADVEGVERAPGGSGIRELFVVGEPGQMSIERGLDIAAASWSTRGSATYNPRW